MVKDTVLGLKAVESFGHDQLERNVLSKDQFTRHPRAHGHGIHQGMPC